LNSHC